MIRVLFYVIVLSISSRTVTADEIPDLACLSGESVNEIFESRLRKSGRSFLVIVGAGVYKSAFDAESWEQSVWNDPEFALYLKEKKLSVVYMDGESDPAFYSTLAVSSYPMVFYFQQKKVRSSRSGLANASEESRKNMIEWIEAVGSGTTPVEAAYEKVYADPENIELRVKLRIELWAERRETEILEQHCWMLDHNELYFQYSAKEYLNTHDQELSENEYRAGLIWMVMSMRDNLGLYRQESINSPTSDGWADGVSLVEFAEKHPWRDLGSSLNEQSLRVKRVMTLKNDLESRRESGLATDRDLFILKVLTVEGDESRAIIEKYQPYFK